jgi:HlyD family secretion protein
MRPIPKLPYIVIGAIILLVAFTFGIGTFARGRNSTAPVMQYTVARVARGDIVQSINAAGQLSPAESVEISSQISGIVTLVAVDFNSPVKAGQVLAKIDPATYEQKLRQTQADLLSAQAAYKLADVSARRLRDLRRQDLVTQQDNDQAEAQAQAALAALTTRRAAVESARVDLDRCTITSPIDGIVIYRQIEVGKTVVSSFSAPVLFTIAKDLSKMRIIASISEVDVGLAQPGQLARFAIDALPGQQFEGRITQIRNPYTPSDKQTVTQPQKNTPVTFDAVIEVDNSSLALRPSLTANVSIIVNRRVNTLRIPNGALRLTLAQAGVLPNPATVRLGDSSAVVYRIPGGDRHLPPQEVTVQLGLSDGGETEILAGLSSGDLIVTGIAAAQHGQNAQSFFF